MATRIKDDNTTKVRILKPILDHWNSVHEDNWTIVTFSGGSCYVRRAVLKDGHLNDDIHGCLLTDIAGICNAYNWTWAVYHDQENGMYIHV